MCQQFSIIQSERSKVEKLKMKSQNGSPLVLQVSLKPWSSRDLMKMKLSKEVWIQHLILIISLTHSLFSCVWSIRLHSYSYNIVLSFPWLLTIVCAMSTILSSNASSRCAGWSQIFVQVGSFIVKVGSSLALASFSKNNKTSPVKPRSWNSVKCCQQNANFQNPGCKIVMFNVNSL